MIVQEFLIDRYDWVVRVYYAVRGYNFDNIEEAMYALQASDEDVSELMSQLEEGIPNIGYIYSNLYDRKSIIIISPTTSADEFQDTFDHEKGHLAMHICLADNIDPFSEKYQYLTGEIGRKMFNVGKMFLCENCRKEWLD